MSVADATVKAVKAVKTVKAVKAVKAPAAKAVEAVKAVKAPAAKAAKVKASAPLPRPSIKGSDGALAAARSKLTELCTPSKASRFASAYNIFLSEKTVKGSCPEGVSHKDNFGAAAKAFRLLPSEEMAKYKAMSKEAAAKQKADSAPTPGAGTLKLVSEAAVARASSAVTQAVLEGFFADLTAVADSLIPGSSQKLLIRFVAHATISKDEKGVPNYSLTISKNEKGVPNIMPKPLPASAEKPLPGE